MNELNIRKTRNGRWKTQNLPVAFDDTVPIPVRALTEELKVYGEYKTLTQAHNYLRVGKSTIIRSFSTGSFVKTNKGKMRFERII